jgi:hypothetical protein
MSYVLGGFIHSPIVGVGLFYICLFYFYGFSYSFHFSKNVTYTPNLKMFALHGYGFSFFGLLLYFIFEINICCVSHAIHDDLLVLI